ncbi:MAG: DNA adenine methylase [Candidatus Porifericomitaceae bacterium WSBS_2022_MAG_OTU9]
MSVLPHPFPYQGSKRGIAKLILPYFPVLAARLVEPFCGSAAVSIAAAAGGLTSACPPRFYQLLIGLCQFCSACAACRCL